MKTFEFYLRHDNGLAIVRYAAKNFAVALINVMNIENCPQSAISSWRVVPTKKEIIKTQNMLRAI